MPDTITYLVNMPGAGFNRHLNPADRMPAGYFGGRVPRMPDSREARLLNHDEYVGVDLTGIWTAIVLVRPYGALLEFEALDAEALRVSAKVRGEVLNWERKLRELAPAAGIHRVATSLFRAWVAAHDLPIYDHQDMRQFFDWLAAQEDAGLYSRWLAEA
jgi:hypothetical protein